MKKLSRKGLVKKLDKVFSLYIRKREPYCVICRSKYNLTCGHLFSRINYSTRWDEDNCHTQCWGCNYKHEFDWEPFRKWFVDTYGEEKYQEVYHRHLQPRKFKDYELLQMIERYSDL